MGNSIFGKCIIIFLNLQFLLVLGLSLSLISASHAANLIWTQGMWSYDRGFWKHESKVVSAPILYSKISHLVKLQNDNVNATMCEVPIHDQFLSVFSSKKNDAINFVWIMCLVSTLLITVLLITGCHIWIAQSKRLLSSSDKSDQEGVNSNEQDDKSNNDNKNASNKNTGKPMNGRNFTIFLFFVLACGIMMSLAAIVITSGINETCNNLPKNGCYVSCCTCTQRICINEDDIFAGREGYRCQGKLDMQEFNTLEKAYRAAQDAKISSIVSLLSLFICAITFWVIQRRAKAALNTSIAGIGDDEGFESEGRELDEEEGENNGERKDSRNQSDSEVYEM